MLFIKIRLLCVINLEFHTVEETAFSLSTKKMEHKLVSLFFLMIVHLLVFIPFFFYYKRKYTRVYSLIFFYIGHLIGDLKDFVPKPHMQQ